MLDVGQWLHKCIVKLRFGKVTNKNDFLCSIITWKSAQCSKISRKCLLFFLFAGNTRTVVSWETSVAGPKKLSTVHQSKSHASPGNKWASDMITHTEVSQVGFITATGGKRTTLRLYIFRPCLHVTFFLKMARCCLALSQWITDRMGGRPFWPLFSPSQLAQC